MYKTSARNRRASHSQNEYDLYGDLAKIKAAIADATFDVKGKAGEVLSQSIDGIKERSAMMQENVSAYAANKPFKTIGMALLTGLVVGYFLRK